MIPVFCSTYLGSSNFYHLTLLWTLGGNQDVFLFSVELTVKYHERESQFHKFYGWVNSMVAPLTTIFIQNTLPEV